MLRILHRVETSEYLDRLEGILQVTDFSVRSVNVGACNLFSMFGECVFFPHCAWVWDVGVCSSDIVSTTAVSTPLLVQLTFPNFMQENNLRACNFIADADNATDTDKLGFVHYHR